MRQEIVLFDWKSDCDGLRVRNDGGAKVEGDCGGRVVMRRVDLKWRIGL